MEDLLMSNKLVKIIETNLIHGKMHCLSIVFHRTSVHKCYVWFMFLLFLP